MKNWNYYRIISLLSILFFTFIFISCDKDTVLCNCVIKEHLGMDETCCGGENCNCFEQIKTLTGTEINIRKQAGITVEQLNTTAILVNNVFTNSLATGEKPVFISKITEIHIVTGSNVSHLGTIVNVGCDSEFLTVEDYFLDDIVYGN